VLALEALQEVRHFVVAFMGSEDGFHLSAPGAPALQVLGCLGLAQITPLLIRLAMVWVVVWHHHRCDATSLERINFLPGGVLLRKHLLYPLGDEGAENAELVCDLVRLKKAWLRRWGFSLHDGHGLH